ncbi:winged helix-turn-helix transcriptional regulator [Hymenobacter wooponensis]|uniref:winged helix-turn-helix transcriptional regulator n=1 Tax=Hymenobacter wooponensis TaxID=1525360 RepID=UPI003CC9E2A6
MILTEGTTKRVACIEQMMPIRDALEVISGKWKMLILTSIMHGNRRFTEIQASIPKINPKGASQRTQRHGAAPAGQAHCARRIPRVD